MEAQTYGPKSLARISSEGGVSKVQALADWLQSDIRRRGLRPGDRYLTSEEAATALEVSTGTAHQAMRLLVDRNILNRKRKQGTYIGSAVEPPSLIRRLRVYVLLPSDATRDASYARLSDSIYPAISTALDGASLQLEYLPPGDSMGFVRALAEEADQAGNLGGFFLMRSTFDLQNFFQQNCHRYPAVVAGSLYPGIDKLPGADADQFFVGQQCADFILKAGRRRVAVLMYEHWAPGDSRLTSGVCDAFATAKERLESFEICSLPAYEQAIRVKVLELLTSPERPTAMIVRMALQARVVFDVANELGLRIPEDLHVVFGNLRQQLPAGMEIPHFVAEYDMNRLSRMLAELRAGKPVEECHVIYPVRFVNPQNS